MTRKTQVKVINHWREVEQDKKLCTKRKEWTILGGITEDNFYYSNNSTLLKKNVTLNEI